MLFECITALALSWVSWRILRRMLVKTDLDNVRGPASPSFLTGNFSQVFDINAWDFHKQLRQKYGNALRLHAVFGDKMLYVSDPKALQHIFVKDQDTFEETGAYLAFTEVLFGKGLLATLGEQHRRQRKMINPSFSIAHMRHMIPIFYDVTHKLGNTLKTKLSSGPQEIDIMHWITRTALELIAQSGLGYSIDSLADNADHHPYSNAAKNVMPVMFTMVFVRTFLLTTLVKIGPPKFRRFMVDIMPFKNVRKLRDIVDILDSTATEILEAKRRALREGDEAVARQIGQGKDVMSVLLRANMEASEEDKLPEYEVLGQMSTLIFAAMDPTSNAMTRILHLMALHPEVQEKLRQEIMDALELNGGRDFTWDELDSLTYLDAVCRETLRIFPPLPQLLRTARKDIALPLSTPITGADGREMHEIIVPKDTNVVISILNCNSDPALWGPDSYEWKPERWLSPLPDSIKKAPVPGIYSHLMTFLAGGRACIGFKFAQLEIKVVMSVLLSKFRFELSDKEIVWEMSDISMPAVKGQPRVRQMPLKVTPL